MANSIAATLWALVCMSMEVFCADNFGILCGIFGKLLFALCFY